MSRARALILGCGYVGTRLALRLRDEGVSVMGTTRGGRGEEIAATGALPVIADVLEPSSLRPAADWRPTVIFDLVRPQEVGEDAYTAVGSRNVLEAFSGAPPEALVYVSSTSVYGRRSGEWTDEATPVEPSSPLGQARVDAERVYLDAAAHSGFPARVCRVPGIYGPGRTLRERLELGAYRRMDDREYWVSRVHVDDLVEGLIAAWRKGRPGEVYLLCDDEPLTAAEYAELTASLLDIPMPPTVSREDIRQELSRSAFERRVGARRCSNARMREELQVTLRYPSAREGVPAALREEGAI